MCEDLKTFDKDQIELIVVGFIETIMKSMKVSELLTGKKVEGIDDLVSFLNAQKNLFLGNIKESELE